MENSEKAIYAAYYADQKQRFPDKDDGDILLDYAQERMDIKEEQEKRKQEMMEATRTILNDRVHVEELRNRMIKENHTFEWFIDKQIKDMSKNKERLQQAIDISNDRWLEVSMHKIVSVRMELIQISMEYMGKYEQESEEFNRVYLRWWFLYGNLMSLRTAICNVMGLSMPRLDEIMPDHAYMGVLWGKEDFERFMKKGCKELNIVPLEKEIIDGIEREDLFRENE